MHSQKGVPRSKTGGPKSPKRAKKLSCDRLCCIIYIVAIAPPNAYAYRAIKARASRIKPSSALSRSCGLAPVAAAFAGGDIPVIPFACFFGLLVRPSTSGTALARRFLLGGVGRAALVPKRSSRRPREDLNSRRMTGMSCSSAS